MSWWVFALLSALFAAVTAVFAKAGVKGVDADLATAVRTIIIMIAAWGIVAVRGSAHGLTALSRQNWIFLILSGTATALSWIFYFRALKAGTVAQVAAVDKLSVALAILLSVIFLGETLTLKTAVAATLIIAGTIILIV